VAHILIRLCHGRGFAYEDKLLSGGLGFAPGLACRCHAQLALLHRSLLYTENHGTYAVDELFHDDHELVMGCWAGRAGCQNNLAPDQVQFENFWSLQGKVRTTWCPCLTRHENSGNQYMQHT
jgi:hypothetical protein